jgi:hypothetical protein
VRDGNFLEEVGCMYFTQKVRIVEYVVVNAQFVHWLPYALFLHLKYSRACVQISLNCVICFSIQRNASDKVYNSNSKISI